jgi:hypothetical protein
MEANTMPGPRSTARLRSTAAALSAAALLSVPACTTPSEPTATQAGQTLKSHILELLKERNAQNITITDPGGKNVPCGEGRAKQTFAATGTDVAASTTAPTIRTLLLGAIDRVAAYEVVNAGSMMKPVHVVDHEARTELVLDSPREGWYSVSGQTECLGI